MDFVAPSPWMKIIALVYKKVAPFFGIIPLFPLLVFIFLELLLLFLSSSSRYPLASEHPRCLKKKKEINLRVSCKLALSRTWICAGLCMNFLQRSDNFIWHEQPEGESLQALDQNRSRDFSLVMVSKNFLDLICWIQRLDIHGSIDEIDASFHFSIKSASYFILQVLEWLLENRIGSICRF